MWSEKAQITFGEVAKGNVLLFEMCFTKESRLPLITFRKLFLGGIAHFELPVQYPNQQKFQI
jgi:hypothetical protein